MSISGTIFRMVYLPSRCIHILLFDCYEKALYDRIGYLSNFSPVCILKLILIELILFVIKMSVKRRRTENPQDILCDDVFLEILSFLSQKELTVISQTCKRFYKLRYQSYHLRYYIVYNRTLAQYAQKQINLDAIVIRGTKDAQLFFNKLPAYVFIGHFSSFHPHTKYSDMYIMGAKHIQYPHTKVLFIEEAAITINWEMFPNLEELYIETSHLGLNIDSLVKCTKLRKIIIWIKKGRVYLNTPLLLNLPNLEVFAVTGSLSSPELAIVEVSSKLYTYLFFSVPEVYDRKCCYITSSRNCDLIEATLRLLLNTHHRPPEIITSNI